MVTMFDTLCDWRNLWQAWQAAARGKRRHASAAAFEHHLADALLTLQHELRSGSYRPGPYCHFTIREPKLRRISAAPFRDRVVHHALCQVIEPLFEPMFIPHSYANRVARGTHRAIAQAQDWARRFRYALRGDVVQHFASIDHGLLLGKLARRVDDPRVLALAATVLASGDQADEPSPTRYFAGDDLFAACRPRGLPIGNLTSQFWSNVYLNDFDWFVVREQGCGAYLRYVDDFVLFGHDKGALQAQRSALIDRLAQERLALHTTQFQVTPTRSGIPWLGFVVYPTHRLLKRRKLCEFTRRLDGLIGDYRSGRISFAERDASVQGWINHVAQADTWGLREHVFANHPIRSGPG